ncbi:hypothetical protein LTR85_006125 [Meristemomyces frigidus]|nr:hypothetical protein LTR85_006125 [Meristemomyces frigidus]
MFSSSCIAALSLLVCTGLASPFERVKALKPLEVEWAATITFGGEDVLVIRNTGSSDTWLVQQGFQCVDINGTDIAEADCYFGPTYNGTFTEGEIANENFNITYGDGEFLSGVVGYTDISIGNITVTHQEVALATKAYWEGDGMTSGLIGLAYSSLTDAFAGDNATIDNPNVTGIAPGDQDPYSPVVQRMIAQGLNPPLFTLALERSSDLDENVPGGYVAFGGLPPVSGTTGPFYSILPDGYVYKNNASVITTYPTTYDAIVDSGTTLLYVPTAVASGYIASFEPPAVVYEGDYYCPCNATAPYFGIEIAGETFNISSADIILPDSGFVSNATGIEYCLIGVLDGGSGADGLTIFGDVFLKNVVAVFDVGASILRFAQHTY